MAGRLTCCRTRPAAGRNGPGGPRTRARADSCMTDEGEAAAVSTVENDACEWADRPRYIAIPELPVLGVLTDACTDGDQLEFDLSLQERDFAFQLRTSDLVARGNTPADKPIPADKPDNAPADKPDDTPADKPE